MQMYQSFLFILFLLCVIVSASVPSKVDVPAPGLKQKWVTMTKNRIHRLGLSTCNFSYYFVMHYSIACLTL